jgi:predicted transcriptional regulator
MLIEGEKPPFVYLYGNTGGKASGGTWGSDELRDIPMVMFYVDPDKIHLNKHVTDSLESAGIDSDRYGVMTVINMAATWLPDKAVERMFRSQQRKHIDILYVKDNEKILVKAWGLEDNTSNILAFDAKGRLLFQQTGRLSYTETDQLIRLIREAVAHPPSPVVD